MGLPVVLSESAPLSYVVSNYLRNVFIPNYTNTPGNNECNIYLYNHDLVIMDIY